LPKDLSADAFKTNTKRLSLSVNDLRFQKKTSLAGKEYQQPSKHSQKQLQISCNHPANPSV